MPLGIVSHSDYQKEKNNSSIEHQSIPKPTENPIITSDVLPSKQPGRDADVPNVPQSLRKLLGEEVAVNGLRSAMEIANSFGISQPTTSTYARGEISPGVPNKDLSEYINGRKTKISKRALNKLNMALNHIDDSKLMQCDAVELSSVAKNMAAVAGAMEPKDKEEEKKDPVQFHFYAPQVRNENHYETVVAKDNY
jgi:predicted transcriptional regulator